MTLSSVKTTFYSSSYGMWVFREVRIEVNVFSSDNDAIIFFRSHGSEKGTC